LLNGFVEPFFKKRMYFFLSVLHCRRIHSYPGKKRGVLPRAWRGLIAWILANSSNPVKQGLVSLYKSHNYRLLTFHPLV
jgi:hypothetical protein